MKNKFPIADFRFPVTRSGCLDYPVRSASSTAFSLVEVMVVISILSLIVLVLMSVFNSTQAAFRAGVTQSDVLEGSRSAMELVTADLKLMAPSGDYSNNTVNLSSTDNGESTITALAAYTPLTQTLLGVTTPNTVRTNLLNYFFFLTKQGTSWTGIGYVVNSSSTSPLYPLYRYHVVTNQNAAYYLAGDFFNKMNTGQWTNMSHLIDGVVDLRLRAYDVNGYPMTANTFFSNSGQWFTNQNVAFYPPAPNHVGREVGYQFYSNTLPATVELQVGVLEDRVLQRAESLAGSSSAQTNYLANQAGRVHVFRQRVTIPNLDRTSYQ